MQRSPPCVIPLDATRGAALIGCREFSGGQALHHSVRFAGGGIVFNRFPGGVRGRRYGDYARIQQRRDQLDHADGRGDDALQ